MIYSLQKDTHQKVEHNAVCTIVSAAVVLLTFYFFMIVAAPRSLADYHLSHLTPPQATRCLELYSDAREGCEMASYDLKNFPTSRDDCFVRAKRAFLTCALKGSTNNQAKNNAMHKDPDDDDQFETTFNELKLGKVPVVAEGLGGIGGVATDVVEPVVGAATAVKIAVKAGGKAPSIWQWVKNLFGFSTPIPPPVSPATDDKEKTEKDAVQAVSVQTRLVAQADIPVLESAPPLRFVIVNELKSTKEPIKERLPLYMLSYRPERYSDAAGLYFALDATVDTGLYLYTRMNDGQNYNMMAAGFKTASSFEEEVFQTIDSYGTFYEMFDESVREDITPTKPLSPPEPTSPSPTLSPTSKPTPPPPPPPPATSSCNIPAFQACANTFSLQGCINVCPYVSRACPPGTPPNTDCKETDKACSDSCWNKADEHLDSCLLSNNCTKEEIIAGGGGAQK